MIVIDSAAAAAVVVYATTTRRKTSSSLKVVCISTAPPDEMSEMSSQLVCRYRFTAMHQLEAAALTVNLGRPLLLDNRVEKQFLADHLSFNMNML